MTEHLNDALISRIADGEDVAPPHLRECARCANALASTLQLKRAVRGVVPRVQVPPSLLQRVSRERGREVQPWWMAIAAAVLIAIVAGASAMQSRSAATRELVDLHTTIVGSASPIDVLSTDRHTVKPWFEGRVPFSVDVPELAGTPLRLIGGRVVFWRGEPGAYMLIGKGGHRISLFEFREERAPSLSDMASMTVESWEKNGLRYIVVGDVPRSDLAPLQPTSSQ